MQIAGEKSGVTRRLASRLCALILVGAVLGLPINHLSEYWLALAAAVLVATGSIATGSKRWTIAVVLAVLVAAGHAIWPAPRIDEGHNVFLPGPRVAETSGLPAAVVSVLTRQFDEEYPPARRCADLARGCWRPDRTAAADGFAFSADGIVRPSELSAARHRHRFFRSVCLRFGVTQRGGLRLARQRRATSKRFERDRRSLNLFDRFRVTFPLLLTYRFPADFVGSDVVLARHRAVGKRSGMNRSTFQRRRTCVPRARARGCRPAHLRDLDQARCQAGDDAAIATPRVQFRRGLAFGLSRAGRDRNHRTSAYRVEPRRLRLPATLIAFTLLVTMFVDVEFIRGLRPLDSGDDGIKYEGFARAIVRHLLAGDIVAALKGEEADLLLHTGLSLFPRIRTAGFRRHLPRLSCR